MVKSSIVVGNVCVFVEFIWYLLLSLLLVGLDVLVSIIVVGLGFIVSGGIIFLGIIIFLGGMIGLLSMFF